MRIALLCRLCPGQEPAPGRHISEPPVVRLREGPDQGAGVGGIGVAATRLEGDEGEAVFLLGMGTGVQDSGFGFGFGFRKVMICTVEMPRDELLSVAVAGIGSFSWTFQAMTE